MQYQFRHRLATRARTRFLLLVLSGWFAFGYQPCLMAQPQIGGPQIDNAHDPTSSAIHRQHDNPDCSTGQCTEDKQPGAPNDFGKMAGDSDESPVFRILLIVNPTRVENIVGSIRPTPASLKSPTGPPLHIRLCTYLI